MTAICWSVWQAPRSKFFLGKIENRCAETFLSNQSTKYGFLGKGIFESNYKFPVQYIL